MMVVLPLPLWPTMTVTGEKNSTIAICLSSKERIPRIASLSRCAINDNSVFTNRTRRLVAEYYEYHVTVTVILQRFRPFNYRPFSLSTVTMAANNRPNKLAFLSMPAPASYVAGLGRGCVQFRISGRSANIVHLVLPVSQHVQISVLRERVPLRKSSRMYHWIS